MTGHPTWRGVTKRTLDLFGRWGDSRTQIRGMLDHSVPVVVVDRFRDDEEGSVFGLHGQGNGAVNSFSSVSFGSVVNDWELHQVTSLSYSASAVPFTTLIHMFTPIFPYNPALIQTPVGFFRPGLINNRAFTFGTVTAIGGNNPAFPTVVGPTLMPFAFGSSTLDFSFPVVFDPPIRVYRDTTLTFQWLGDVFGVSVTIFVDILYTERPKVSR